MEQIVIEAAHAGTFRKEYHKFAKDEIIIGRSFGCDLILSDAYVSASHVKIRREGDGWIIEDCESANGVYFHRLRKCAATEAIHSGEEITIGKTRLRFFLADHPVRAAVPLSANDNFLRRIQNPLSLWFALIAVSILCSFVHTINSFEFTQFPETLFAPMAVMFPIVLFAGIWALVGRVIKHKWHYALQVTVLCYFSILFIVGDNICDWIGYVFVDKLFIYVLVTLGVYVTLWVYLLVAQLGIATLLPMKKRVVAAFSVGILIVFATGVLVYVNHKEFSSDPPVDIRIFPPIISPIKACSVQMFIGDSQKIFDEVRE